MPLVIAMQHVFTRIPQGTHWPPQLKFRFHKRGSPGRLVVEKQEGEVEASTRRHMLGACRGLARFPVEGKPQFRLGEVGWERGVPSAGPLRPGCHRAGRSPGPPRGLLLPGLTTRSCRGEVCQHIGLFWGWARLADVPFTGGPGTRRCCSHPMQPGCSAGRAPLVLCGSQTLPQGDIKKQENRPAEWPEHAACAAIKQAGPQDPTGGLYAEVSPAHRSVRTILGRTVFTRGSGRPG